MSEVDNIVIEYINEIDNIVVSVGADVQSVFSVNTLTGNVNLTSYGTLSSGTASGGIYTHTFTHSLNYDNPIVFLYNTYNQLVFSDVEIIDANNVTIKAAIDLSGYKVVVQR
jgi:hypothetical protein